MLGGGTFVARWRHAGDFTDVAFDLPACTSCFAGRLKPASRGTVSEYEEGHCPFCSYWDTDSKSGILDFIPPGDYPKHALPPSGKLRPKKLIYDIMKEAVTVCHDNLVDNLWTVPVATDFLHVNQLNAEANSNIFEFASNCKNLAQLEASMDLNPQQYDENQQEKESNPHLFQRWRFPSIWMWRC